MDIVNLPLDLLREAPWNPNTMDEAMLARLRESVTRYGIVENLVVRPLNDKAYEVIGGNQRLRVLRESGVTDVSCVVVDLDDTHARLLAQALNRIEGSDDLGLKAELVRDILRTLPQSEVLGILPETADSLKALASLGEVDIAEHLQAWEEAQAARLRHMTFQLVPSQLDVVEEAFERVMAGATKDGSNPNRRGNALYQLCLDYLKRGESQ